MFGLDLLKYILTLYVRWLADSLSLKSNTDSLVVNKWHNTHATRPPTLRHLLPTFVSND